MIDYNMMQKLLKRFKNTPLLTQNYDSIFAKSLWTTLQTHSTLNFMHINRLKQYFIEQKVPRKIKRKSKKSKTSNLTKLNNHKAFEYPMHKAIKNRVNKDKKSVAENFKISSSEVNDLSEATKNNKQIVDLDFRKFMINKNYDQKKLIKHYQRPKTSKDHIEKKAIKEKLNKSISRVDNMINKKEEFWKKVNEEKQQNEKLRLKECTFRPHTNLKQRKNDNPMTAKASDRNLELYEKSKNSKRSKRDKSRDDFEYEAGMNE